MKRNKDGGKHRHIWNIQDYPFVPTAPAQLMDETASEFLTRLGYVGRKLRAAHPEAPLGDVLAALEKLRQFCQAHRTSLG